MTLTPRPVKCQDVEKFIDYCITLRSFWAHYQIIFEGSDLKQELLQNTANTFFCDLNLVLIEHLVLQVCKLTDPETTANKYNLSVEFLTKNANFSDSPETLEKIRKIAARIQKFRDVIVPARNKLIGHLDLNAALGPKSFGAASIAEWNLFWLDLQDFVTIMHSRYVNASAPFYLNSVGMLSDADQLVKALKESTYFKMLLDDGELTSMIFKASVNSKYYEA